MRTERRCTQRRRPGGISYFEFEAGSGGIVLDASEKGLAFQAADAVYQLGPSRISISPNPEERIEVNGEVVWVDRSKKTGGLRFADTGVDTSKRIRDWLKQSGESNSDGNEEFPLPAWAVQDLREVPSKAHQRDVKPPASLAAPSDHIEVREEQRAARSVAPALPPFSSQDLTWAWQDSPKTRGGFANGLATGFLIVVFVLAPVALFENFGYFAKFRPLIGNSLIRLGEKLSGHQGPQSQNNSPSQGAVPAPAPAPNKQASDASQQETAGNFALPNSSAQNSSQTPVSEIPQAKESADHSTYSRDPHLAQGRSTQAASLWSAVGAGSSAAEVDLAQLYLKGDGVPRNCEQARILLRAAAKGGSREARRQLQKLRSYGCR